MFINESSTQGADDSNKLNLENQKNFSCISVDGLVCYERGRLSNPDNFVIVKPIA